MGENTSAAAFDRMKNKVHHSEAAARAVSELMADDVNDRFASMEKEQEIDRLLNDLKSKRKSA